MTEYQKTYIDLNKQFVATNEGPDSVRARYTLSLIHICWREPTTIWRTPANRREESSFTGHWN